MIRRVNIIAGPGRGKSTLAASLFSEFKNNSKLTVELVTEFVKPWAYIGRVPKCFDQVFITASQMHAESIPLEAGVDLIITDSPLFLGGYYASKGLRSTIFDLASKFEVVYPSINIVINWKKPYVQTGRFQSEIEADNIHKELLGMARSLPNLLIYNDTIPAYHLMKVIQEYRDVQHRTGAFV